MIGRQIQEQADVRAKRVDQLELEAAEFDDRDGIVFDSSTREISGVPIFPARIVGNPAVCRMCSTSAVVVVLPFEPVMPTSGRAETDTPTRFRSKSYAGSRGKQRRKIRRNARARDDQILRQKGFLAVAAEFERTPASRSLRTLRRSRFGSRFGGGDARAARRAEQRRRHACARQPDNQHAFPSSSIHRAVPFNSIHSSGVTSISASSAQTAQKSAPAIQNRTMTFDSLQPTNSK